MSGRMKRDDLIERLAGGSIVPLTAGAWKSLSSAFAVVEDIDTTLAGHILLVRRPVPGRRHEAWAIVEDPEPGRKVIRPLANEKEARALIAERLAAYDRMWDG